MSNFWGILQVTKKTIAKDILHSGGIKARKVIANTVNEAKEYMGVPSY